MIAAVFGLVGVLVGGLLTATAQYSLGVRNEFAAATVAARLIAVELDVLCGRVAAAVSDTNGREDLDAPAWDEQQAALALVLPDDHWKIVEAAYVRLTPRRTACREGDTAASDFVQAAKRARTTLLQDMEEHAPLRRRGSFLERWMARWPTPPAV